MSAAELEKIIDEAFEKRDGIGRRPPFDPALAALGPVLDGKVPMVFEADGRDNIHRALDFAAEFKLKPVIYGGKDAWKLADRLAAEKVPVLLRMTFTLGNRASIISAEPSAEALSTTITSMLRRGGASARLCRQSSR